MSDGDHDDYKVGYKKPPVDTRFKPGESGNSNGRKKASETDLSLTEMLGKFAARKIQITENGKRKRITTYEALWLRVMNNALQGDTASMRLIVQAQEDKLRKRSPKEKRLEKELAALKEELHQFQPPSTPVTPQERDEMIEEASRKFVSLFNPGEIMEIFNDWATKDRERLEKIYWDSGFVYEI